MMEIVFLESSEDLRAVVRACLESEGFVMHEAVCTAAVLDSLSHYPEVAALILDFGRDLNSGYELLDQLLRDKKVGNFNIIVTSAYEPILKSFPTVKYLRKPYDLAALLTCLKLAAPSQPSLE